MNVLQSTQYSSLKSRVLQFVRFCVVGGIVLAMDFALIWLLSHFVPNLVAVSMAYVLAVSAHFLLNKLWVFQARRTIAASETARYLICVGVCWFATVSIVWLALHRLTDHVLIAKAIAVPPTTLLAYLLLRFFVFQFSLSPSGRAQDDV